MKSLFTLSISTCLQSCHSWPDTEKDGAESNQFIVKMKESQSKDKNWGSQETVFLPFYCPTHQQTPWDSVTTPGCSHSAGLWDSTTWPHSFSHGHLPRKPVCSCPLYLYEQQYTCDWSKCPPDFSPDLFWSYHKASPINSGTSWEHLATNNRSSN